MNKEEMIDIIEALAEGAPVERITLAKGGKWERVYHKSPDFQYWVYRRKPATVECWANTYERGDNSHHVSVLEAEEAAEASTGVIRTSVHLVEQV